MDENAPPPLNTPPPPPPPVAPPPLITAPPAARPSSKGRGWMVFALILLVFLGISMLFNARHFVEAVVLGKAAHSNRTAGPRLDEVIYQDNEAVNKIALIEVDGIITGRVIDQGGFSLVDLIKAQLKRAEEDDRVKAVILKVDSPGGEVLASDDINHEIADFQSRTHKPVVASMGSLAASGGYYISAPCRWIVANELTITGSIGVIMSSWNYRGLMDKVGVLPQTFKSGKYKDMLSGSREPDSITQEEKDMIQGLINETFAKFKSVVQEGRGQAYAKNKNAKDKGRNLSDDWQNYADGRVLSGTEAFRLGFVDELGGFDEAVERTKKLTGISGANLIQYQQRYDLSDLFRLFGKSDAKAIKVDLGMEMPKLQAGKLYFLSPTFLH
jgi:protease-4